MKRTAADAFGSNPKAPPSASSSGAFQPSGAACFDPKAYFLQWSQAAAAAPAVPEQGAAAVPAAAVSGQSELLERLKSVSAVRCATIVQEKGNNFTTTVQIEALHTMAVKSSFKHREELVKQPHVLKLAKKVLELAKRPPQGLSLPQLAKAVWSLTRFGDEVRGDAPQMLSPAAQAIAALPPAAWDAETAETASKILWCLARTDSIYPYKKLLSQIVKEIIKDKGLRLKELSDEGLVNLLFAVARARQHNHKGDHRTVHLEANDETLFDYAGGVVKDKIDTISVQLLGDIIERHSEVGLRREGFFKAVCPRILKDQKDLREDVMAKIIKAYTRFMIPLKEAPQGFRTMAVVAKGDFGRPSDKPQYSGKKVFDKPQPLFAKTQLHARA